MSRAEIVVVGSINQDITAVVPRLPGPGETVLGSGHRSDAGGKGANQAVAAARLGRHVAMVGRVGDDAGGRKMLTGLRRDGIDTEYVAVDDEAGTGLALITVDDRGENMIVVSPGANARVGRHDVVAAAPVLDDAAVTLLQLEIPLATVQAAAAAAGGVVVLNPAPARPLPPGLLEEVDVLVPNQTELALLAGVAAGEDIGWVSGACALIEGPGALVVTLGARGAFVHDDGGGTLVPAPEVTAVDATAAGDAFCGALADALVRRRPLHDAVQWAVAAGAWAATKPGAQASLPTAADVAGLMA